MSVLREPVERVLSHLRHHRKLTPRGARPVARGALRRGAPPEFFHNHMVKMFSLTAAEIAEVGRARRVGGAEGDRLHARAARPGEGERRAARRARPPGPPRRLLRRADRRVRLAARRAPLYANRTPARGRSRRRSAHASRPTTRSTPSSGEHAREVYGRTRTVTATGAQRRRRRQSAVPSRPTGRARRDPDRQRAGSATSVCASDGLSMPTPKHDRASRSAAAGRGAPPPSGRRCRRGRPSRGAAPTGARSGGHAAAGAVVELHQREPEPVGRGFDGRAAPASTAPGPTPRRRGATRS